MKIGNYKGLHASFPEIKVTEEDIEKVLKNEQRINSIIIQRDGTKIRVLQKLDDDFAKDFSEYDTLAEWKEAIHEELYEMREEEAEEALNQALLEQVLADSDIPVDTEIREMLFEDAYEELIERINSMHLDMAEYAKRTGRTEEEIIGNLQQEVDFSIKSQTLLHAIAKTEGITVSPEEIAEYLDGDEDDEEIEALADELVMDAALALIKEAAVIEEE